DHAATPVGSQPHALQVHAVRVAHVPDEAVDAGRGLRLRPLGFLIVAGDALDELAVGRVEAQGDRLGILDSDPVLHQHADRRVLPGATQFDAGAALAVGHDLAEHLVPAGGDVGLVADRL